LGLASFDLDSFGLDSFGFDSLGFDLGAATVDIFVQREKLCGVSAGWWVAFELELLYLEITNAFAGCPR
jgi:hypothetical protein